MATILDRIVETKRKEVEIARQRCPTAELRTAIRRTANPRNFLAAATAKAPDGINLIAEIKKRSPSAGLIVPDFDLVRIARTYQAHGAAALSVLTDETYFGGRLDFIGIVKRVVDLPVLRKDFIVDEYQIHESRAADADAVLLIAEVLGAERIAELLPLVDNLDMTALVEVHSEENLEAILDALGAPGDTYLLGINNRDLSAQRTDVGTTAKLAGVLPHGAAFVAESGIATRADVLTVQRAGACAILVGESLLKADDLGAKIDELLGK